MTRFQGIGRIGRRIMSHNRKLVLGGASLTQAKCNRHTATVGTEVRDRIEEVMNSVDFLKRAPFQWIGLMLRFGLRNETEPHYLGIDENDGEIALAIELDTHELQHASHEELTARFMVATLRALIDVGKKYNLPYVRLQEMLAEIEIDRAKNMT